MDEIVELVDDQRDDQIVKLRLTGVGVRAIAKQFSISTAEVERVIDRMLAHIDAGFRVRTARLELERLDLLHRAYFAKALSGDTAAGQLLVRIAERRSALLALDSPIRVDIVERQHEVTPAPTSTDRIRAAIDRLTGPSPPAGKSH
ncbi:hypothetical protein [Bradyrhizobium sp. Ai1a-2]|uniref:hypothetical protein n=1 Tax=Bradyrhizobium sp. Ai1a-2 TaxID=196490 RepID=UPI000427B3F9|nr:hypothetical protein [Bradyrhizobium sp. Ai1a-2]